MIGFFITWGKAYNCVKIDDKWQKQLSTLQPWWFLDRKLLPKEDDYLRKRAIIYLLLCFIPYLVFWSFNEV